MRRGLLVLLFSAILLPVMGGTAWAHAQLESTNPQANSIVRTSPQQVVLTFGESVEISSDAIQLYDDHLRKVKTGPVAAVDSNRRSIGVHLSAPLRAGTYAVSWHVTSADTHPVSGTFEFSVGGRSVVTGSIPDAGRNNAAGMLLGITRTMGYFGLVLGPGLLLVVLLLWPAGLGERRTRRLVYTGVSLLAVSTLAAMLLEGVWANGVPISSIWAAPSLLNTHSQRFDLIYAWRFYLLVLLAVLVLVIAAVVARSFAQPGEASERPRRRARQPLLPGATSLLPVRTESPDAPARPRPARTFPRWWVFAAVAACCIALFSTWALAGHAAAGTLTKLAIVSDVFHISAMSLWLGGLVMLVAPLRPAARAGDLARILPKFSQLAGICVAVLAISGGFQAWRDVRTVTALLHTRSGYVLMIKVALFGVLLLLGARARRWVHRYLRGPRPVLAYAATATLTESEPVQPEPYGPAEVKRMRRGVQAEAVIGAVILAITAGLVVMVPSKDAYQAPYQQTLTDGTVQVTLRIDGVGQGDNVMHVSAVHVGDNAAQPVASITGSASLPAKGLGPLPIAPTSRNGSAPDGREDIDLSLPSPGDWTVNLVVTTSQFQATSLAVTIPVPASQQ